MLLLTSADSLSLTLSSAGDIEWFAAYADTSSGAFDAGASSGAASAGTTTSDILTPSSGVSRLVKSFNVLNTGTVQKRVAVSVFTGATDKRISPSVLLDPGECLHFQDNVGWSRIDHEGKVRTTTGENWKGGRVIRFYKRGTAPEGSGVQYSFMKDGDDPDALVIGTPGDSGRVLNGLTTDVSSSITLWSPSTGKQLYIDKIRATASHACLMNLADVLWVAPVASSTLTTAQTVDSVTLPARDLNHSTNGEGVYAALLVTASTNNGSPITNIVIGYTNSEGVAGRQASMLSFPASAVIGTVVPFRLMPGDKGIRSIQSVTLGTSLVSGSVALILFKNIAMMSIISPQESMIDFSGRGIVLHKESSLQLLIYPTSTGAPTVSGELTVIEE